jgi:hypothetical protein
LKSKDFFSKGAFKSTRRVKEQAICVKCGRGQASSYYTNNKIVVISWHKGN